MHCGSGSPVLLELGGGVTRGRGDADSEFQSPGTGGGVRNTEQKVDLFAQHPHLPAEK